MSGASVKAVALRTLATISAVSVLFMMLLTFVDVFLRYWFAHPISGSSEMVSFSLAMLVFAALPIVTAEDAHISVSVLRGRLSPSWEWAVELAVLVFSLASTSLMTYVLFLHGLDLGKIFRRPPSCSCPLRL